MQNCIKRGIASIYPDGQLLAKGHRLILASAEQLCAKIEELLGRIQQLDVTAEAQRLNQKNLWVY